MIVSAARKPLTLADFLDLPETEPASEFVDGHIWQKPMPQGEHSRLQFKACECVNAVGELAQLALAFPELRCTFGGRSIVPDIAVFRWNRIPRTENGRIANRFLTHPDWVIEILSPEQSQTQVLDKLLHCSEQGTELGWLLDAAEETILVVDGTQRIQIVRGEAIAPGLPELSLNLSAAEVFGWLVL